MVHATSLTVNAAVQKDGVEMIVSLLNVVLLLMALSVAHVRRARSVLVMRDGVASIAMVTKLRATNESSH